MELREGVAVVVGGSSVAVVVLAALAGLLWSAHLLGLVAAYAVVGAAAVGFAQAEWSPEPADAVPLSAAVAFVVGAPVALRVGLPAGLPEYRLLFAVRLAGQWALPVALTVPFGLARTTRQRLALAGAHLAALLGLAWVGAVLLGEPRVPTLGATAFTLQQYAVGVVAGYPAVLLLTYRGRLAAALPE